MVGLTDDPAGTFAKAKTTVVTITGGDLYTNKARFALAQDCLPLFYGSGGPHTMDPLGKYLRLTDRDRIIIPGDLADRVKFFCRNEYARRKMIDKLWRLTEPDWSMLDRAIDGERFGGYTRAD